MSDPQLERAYAAYRAHASPSVQECDATWAAIARRVSDEDASAEPASVRARRPLAWSVAAAVLLLVAALVLAIVREQATVLGQADERTPHSAEFGTPEDAPQPSTSREPAVPARPRSPTPALPPAPLEHVASVVEPPPSLRPRVVAPPVVPAPAKAPPVVEEAGLLQAARAALARRQPDRALARLREHARRFADGVLVPERRVLEIRAWCDLGEIGEAQRIAAELGATDSAWAREVQRPCDGGTR